jgi:hypothetical protein
MLPPLARARRCRRVVERDERRGEVVGPRSGPPSRVGWRVVALRSPPDSPRISPAPTSSVTRSKTVMGMGRTSAFARPAASAEIRRTAAGAGPRPWFRGAAPCDPAAAENHSGGDAGDDVSAAERNGSVASCRHESSAASSTTRMPSPGRAAGRATRPAGRSRRSAGACGGSASTGAASPALRRASITATASGALRRPSSCTNRRRSRPSSALRTHAGSSRCGAARRDRP